MDRNNVNINSVSQGTRVLSLKDCRKIVKFSSDVFRLYHVYEIKTSGSAPKQTNKQTNPLTLKTYFGKSVENVR